MFSFLKTNENSANVFDAFNKTHWFYVGFIAFSLNKTHFLGWDVFISFPPPVGGKGKGEGGGGVGGLTEVRPSGIKKRVSLESFSSISLTCAVNLSSAFDRALV